MRVDIEHLSKSFGTSTVLSDVSLSVGEGELCALLGPSGSGKTTLLRIIAGLDFPDEGALKFDAEDVVLRNARDRKIGFVFQHYALFQHMTVQQNIAFGLEIKPRRERPAAAAISKRVGELLDLVQLGDHSGRFPDQLSGGQRQRVALARALAIEPRILLLDEPFGALDARVRKEMRNWLRGLQRKIGLTTLFVTHDQDEALEMADRLAILEQGAIVQVGAPGEVYDRPASPFVYEFLGGANRIDASVRDGALWLEGQPIGAVTAPDATDVRVYVRPHDFDVSNAARPNALSGAVSRIAISAGNARLFVKLKSGAEIEVDIPRHELDELGLHEGEDVSLRLRDYALFGANGARLSSAPPRATSVKAEVKAWS